MNTSMTTLAAPSGDSAPALEAERSKYEALFAENPEMALHAIEDSLGGAAKRIRVSQWQCGLLLYIAKANWHKVETFAGDFYPWAKRVTGAGESTVARWIHLAETYFYTPHGLAVVSAAGGPEQFARSVNMHKAATAEPFLPALSQEQLDSLVEPSVSAAELARDLGIPTCDGVELEGNVLYALIDGERFAIIEIIEPVPPAARHLVLKALAAVGVRYP